MIRQQAFRFELIINAEQEHLMRCSAGCRRFVYNKALALQKARYERGEKHLTYFDLSNLLPVWKQNTDTQFLSEVQSQILQQAMKDLSQAYQNFFAGRAQFPKFKKRDHGDSFRYPQGVRLDETKNLIWFPKMGWVRYRNHRKVLGQIKNATISQKCGKWFVSIQTERDIDIPTHPNAGGDVGIDMGVVRFATMSNGEFFEPLNSFKKHQTSLRKAQQSLSRKKKGSKNREKAKKKVQRIHKRIADCRKDYLHKISSDISKNHALVCIEDLQISNMTKSASGTIDNPGHNVRQKTSLNRSILDQGWGMLRAMLEYKLYWSGGYLVPVSPKNTSRTCPCCGHISADNRKTQSDFICVECGFEENADVVGAINVLRAGLARLACQVSVVNTPAAGSSVL